MEYKILQTFKRSVFGWAVNHEMCAAVGENVQEWALSYVPGIQLRPTLH